MNINNLYEAVPVEKELPPVHRMLNHKNCTSFYPVLLKDGPNDIAFYNYNTGLWVDRWYQSLKDDYEVSFWLRPITRESIEAFLREQHKESKEECERLEKVAKFWQQKYYELNPPYTPPKIDNL